MSGGAVSSILNFSLLGAPGAGKGTLGAFATRELGFVEFDAGSALREWLSEEEDAERQQVRRVLNAGGLAPTPLVMRLYREWIQRNAKPGLRILSAGIPRGDQADFLLADYQAGLYPMNGLVWLEAPEDVVMGRLEHRRTCSERSCQAIYHLVNFPPAQAEVCDRCGSALEIRETDATLAGRMARYREQLSQMIPVRERLVAAGIPLVTIDSSQETSRMFADFAAAVDRLSRVTRSAGKRI